MQNQSDAAPVPLLGSEAFRQAVHNHVAAWIEDVPARMTFKEYVEVLILGMYEYCRLHGALVEHPISAAQEALNEEAARALDASEQAEQAGDRVRALACIQDFLGHLKRLQALRDPSPGPDRE